MQKSLRVTKVTWRCTVFLHHRTATVHYNNWLGINRLLTNARNGEMHKSLLLCQKVKENLQCYLAITVSVLLLTTKREFDSWACSSSHVPEMEKYCRNLCNSQEYDIASKSKKSNVTSSQYSGVLEVSPVCTCDALTLQHSRGDRHTADIARLIMYLLDRLAQVGSTTESMRSAPMQPIEV